MAWQAGPVITGKEGHVRAKHALQNLRNKSDAQAMTTKQDSEALLAAIEERNVLLRELDHRVKNNLQRVISLLEISAQQVSGTNVHPVFLACTNRLHALSLVHETLYRSTNLQQVDFVLYLEQLVAKLCQHYDLPHCQIRQEVRAIPLMLDMDRLIDIGLVLSELLTNIYQHAFSHQQTGMIRIDMKPLDAHMVELIVADNGEGMRQTDAKKANQFGLTFVRAIIERNFAGEVQIQSDNGTRIVMCFPARVLQR